MKLEKVYGQRCPDCGETLWNRQDCLDEWGQYTHTNLHCVVCHINYPQIAAKFIAQPLTDNTQILPDILLEPLAEEEAIKYIKGGVK